MAIKTFSYKLYITIDATNAYDAEVWAKQNCKTFVTFYDHITEDIAVNTSKKDFFFVNSDQGLHDSMIFALKWA